MAASDNLGAVCGIFPPAPLVMLLGLFWVFLGLYHLFIVTMSLMDSALGSMDDWGLQSSCQGSRCHEEWRESFMSCDGSYRTTYRIRYLVIGVFGIFCGMLGFQGALSRSTNMVRAFLFFWVGMISLFIVLLLADETYIDICRVLPRNVQLDVQFFISREQQALMNAMGFKDLTGVRIERIDRLIGWNWHGFYLSLYAAVLVFMVYCANELWKFVKNIDYGPVGLGANFVISTKPNREIDMMAERMNSAVQDYYSAVPTYQSFPLLEDGNTFPYLAKGRGQKCSVNYGTLGVPRPPPPQTD